MKRLITVLLVLLFCCGCTVRKQETKLDPTERYFDMVDLASTYEVSETKPEYYDLSGEVSKIEGGYRYYVFIDNPRIAMYDVEAIAVVEGVDHRKTMAASVGIFEEKEYNMIPNQRNIDRGYVGGIAISGTCAKRDVSLRVFIRWENDGGTDYYRECYRLDIAYDGE